MRNYELSDDNSSTRSDDASDRDNNESLATDDGQTNEDDDEECSEYESPGEERDEGRGGDEMAGAQHVLRRQGDAESEPVAALRLKLALIQEERKLREEERLIRERDWEIEQERRLMLGDGQLSTERVNRVPVTDFRDIKACLPPMQDTDIVASFRSFESILQLNDVDKSLWHKLLPSQLSVRALRVYSRLSLDETKCYDTVKRLILQSYHENVESYLKSFRTMKRTGTCSYKMF